MSNSPVVQLVALIKAKAKEIRLYCQTCGKETMHTFKPAGQWEEYTCPTCGNVQAFRVG